jgi:hypothetical protein
MLDETQLRTAQSPVSEQNRLDDETEQDVADFTNSHHDVLEVMNEPKAWKAETTWRADSEQETSGW